MNAIFKNLVKLLVPEILLSFARKYKSDKKMATWTKYKLVNKKIAIEHNGIIVPKTNYKKRYLKTNDQVEIVHFIGGG